MSARQGGVVSTRTVSAAALQSMRKRGGVWAAYENQALDSSNLGHLQFLQVGPGCTYLEAPDKYPTDSASGMGWKYKLIGEVDLVAGTVPPGR